MVFLEGGADDVTLATLEPTLSLLFVKSRADDSGALRCAASATRRLCSPLGETNVNHAGVKSSIDSSRMFNEPYAEIPSGALGTWGCPGSPGGRVHLSPSPSICLTDSFVSLCLLLFGPGCLPAWTPVTALWGGGVHLSPFVSLHLSPVVSQPGCLARLSSPFVSLHLSPVASQPGCLARLSGWTGSFVSLCLLICLARLSGLFVSLHLSPVVSQPGCLARLSRRTDSLVSLCLPSFAPLSPSLDAWHGSLGGQFHLSPFVSLHLAPADKFQHNKDLTDRRVKAVEDAGAFRAPTNAARSFNPQYGDVQRLGAVDSMTVRSTEGGRQRQRGGRLTRRGRPAAVRQLDDFLAPPRPRTLD